MNNVLQKGVKVTLDKSRTIAYPMSAMAYLAEVYGSVVDAFNAFQSIMPKPGDDGTDQGMFKLDLKTIEVLVHFVTAGFQAEDPDLTFQDVKALIDLNNFNEVMEAVTKALVAYMPQGVAGSTPPRRPKSKS